MIYRSRSRKIFEIVNYACLILFALVIIIPFLNVLAISLSNRDAVVAGKVGIWPVGLNSKAYETIMSNRQFIRCFFNTVFLTVLNTFLCIFISLAAGYALGNKHMPGRKILMTYILIPMYFSGGLIPFYLLVNSIGLNNKFGAIIFPYLVNIFYTIVFRNSINQLPQDIMESAEVDGASEFIILYKIIVPIILPMIMAFTVFSAVNYWNLWYGVLLFLRDTSKWTLQYQLRDLLVNAEMMYDTSGDRWILQEGIVHPQNLRMAALMVTVLPIIVVYPFVQKYFIHGIIVGAVKG